MHRFYVLTILAAIGLAGAVAAKVAFVGGEGPSAAMAEPVEVRVCIREDPPFFYPTGPEGSWAGFEYDLVTAFAEAKGLRLRFVDPGSFSAVFDYLERGDCDLAVSRITRTVEREKRFDFSPGYFPVRVLAVEKEGAATIRTEQLRGKRAVTIPGSTYVGAIDSIGGQMEKVWVETSREMFRAVLDGRADFMACDSAVVLALMEDYPGLQVTVPLSERNYFAIALAKNSKWTEPLTRYMEQFRDDGKLRRLLAGHFGEESADMILSDP